MVRAVRKLIAETPERKGLLSRSAVLLAVLLIGADLIYGWATSEAFRAIVAENVHRWFAEISGALGIGALYNRKKK